MSKTETKSNVFIKSLVKKCGPHTPPEVVCCLLDQRSGREYLVADNSLGRALANYVGEEVEALGAVREREGDRLISIRDFSPLQDSDQDPDEYPAGRSRSGYRRESFEDEDQGRDRGRSKTKAMQSARRLKKDRQEW